MADNPLQAELELTTAEESPSAYVVPVAPEASWPHHSVLLVFTLLWGGNFVLAEVALREMAPISFSVARFLMGGGAMFAILYLHARTEARKNGAGIQLFPSIDRSDWPRLLLISVLGATLAPWLGIEGLSLTNGARASLWLALGPVLSVGIGALMRTERIGRMGYLGVILAGLGAVTLAADGLNPEQAGYWRGDVLLIVALLMAVGELHLIKPLAATYGATPMVAARTAIGGLLYMLIASPSLVEQTWLSFGVWTWVAILAGGAIGIGVGQWVKVRALDTIGPTRVVLYGNLVPVAALVLAWLALGTAPSMLEIVAAVLIILGAVCLEMLDTYKHPTDATTEASL